MRFPFAKKPTSEHKTTKTSAESSDAQDNRNGGSKNNTTKNQSNNNNNQETAQSVPLPPSYQASSPYKRMTDTDHDSSSLPSSERNEQQQHEQQQEPQSPSSMASLDLELQPDEPNATAQNSSNAILCYAFVALGLLNNSPYVIMLASAKNMAQGGVAVVYMANILPGLLVKLTLPYFMEKLSYTFRIQTAAICMMTAFGIVGIFSSGSDDNDNDDNDNNDTAAWLTLAGQLVGVALISSQVALGEASLLALAGKLAPQGTLLTSFSSGTGLAGPCGYLWKILLTEWFHWSLRATCFLAAFVLPLGYYAVFDKIVIAQVRSSCNFEDAISGTTAEQYEQVVTTGEQPPPPQGYQSPRHHELQSPRHHELQQLQTSQHEQSNNNNNAESSARTQSSLGDQETEDAFDDEPPKNETTAVLPHRENSHATKSTDQIAIADMNGLERFRLVLSLWPYIIPLFTVYAAEYSCQSGVWTAIGLDSDSDAAANDPLANEEARNHFYEFANWMYQIGVFLSRSSGNLFTVNMTFLWLMPGLQTVNLIWFYLIATRRYDLLTSWFYEPFPLYSLALCTGLLGGAVYVHGYQRILKDISPIHTEFALSSVSMAESLGILVATTVSLFLQACLYQINGFPGAMVNCPV